jgi:uncharacterized membrane protein YfcA
MKKFCKSKSQGLIVAIFILINGYMLPPVLFNLFKVPPEEIQFLKTLLFFFTAACTILALILILSVIKQHKEQDE